MRNAMVQLGLVVIGVTSVHAVKLLQTSSLHVRVSPSRCVNRVWAIRGKDSVCMTGIEGDYYLTAITPGYWRVRVDAKKPYQNTSMDVICVPSGTHRDLGDISLKN